jgi:transcriptional regulator with XRE-family HTH domain
MGYEEKFVSEKLALGLKCREIRKRKKILQRQMWGIAQLREPHLSGIEHGKINIEFETLYKLKIALKVEIAELFTDRKTVDISSEKFIDSGLAAEKIKFSQRLTQLLGHRKMNQNSLSVLVEIGEGAISMYVNGTHNIELLTMVKIAMALKVEVYDLFDYGGSLPDNSGYNQEEIEP